jgi:hypothetical protein
MRWRGGGRHSSCNAYKGCYSWVRFFFHRRGVVMPDFNFDPSAAVETYRSLFAPTLRAQQEALKTMERFGRYQFAVATDYLEWGVAQAKANLNLVPHSPSWWAKPRPRSPRPSRRVPEVWSIQKNRAARRRPDAAARRPEATWQATWRCGRFPLNSNPRRPPRPLRAPVRRA